MQLSDYSFILPKMTNNMNSFISKILLPHRFHWIGWALFIPSAILALLTLSFEFEFEWLELANVRTPELFVNADENFTNELAVVLLFLSLFFVAFSKEKKEDEYIQKIRLDSILFACYGYFILNIIGALLFYGLDYFAFILFNMYSIPVLFILRFRWIMFKQGQSLGVFA
ncbi:hypothetical protein SAMN04488104_103340 [Algoriphagus faecimaris]|uniref:Uncharacterized protein n=2 Tax=Algoriphagus faecimaris TaxID=686796 RepID=A0A1G6V8H4_9BACT|nr:hypothetical protein SAMN04488104_103340 [Algoriphagus faecimaris]